MKIHDLIQRGGLSGIVAALVLCAGAPSVAQAQTITIQGGSTGCTWTNYTVDANRNHVFNCGSTTPQPGTIQFSTSSFAAQNTGATGNYVAVTRTGGTVGVLSGTVTVSSGSCTVNGGGAVSFPDGSNATQTVSVTTPGTPGSCGFSLAAGSNTTLGSPTTASMQVVDPTTPGAAGFASAAISAQEAGSAVSLGISRTGGGTQAPEVEVFVTLGTSSTAVVGTHYNVAGFLTLPGAGTCPSTGQQPGIIGCTKIPLGASSPSGAVTVTALANTGTTPTLQFGIGIVQPSTVTLGTNQNLTVNITEAPVQVENCTIADASTQLGGNPPLAVTSLASGQRIAYKIPHTLLDGKLVGAYQPSTGVSVSVSNQPCDFGPANTQSQSGCHINLPGNNPTQVLLRVSTVNGYMVCAKPAPTVDGSLYINFTWSGYTNYGQPVTNFCNNLGFTSCNFQFRRDS
jgi:hypothetical protein